MKVFAAFGPYLATKAVLDLGLPPGPWAGFGLVNASGLVVLSIAFVPHPEGFVEAHLSCAKPVRGLLPQILPMFYRYVFDGLGAWAVATLPLEGSRGEAFLARSEYVYDADLGFYLLKAF